MSNSISPDISPLDSNYNDGDLEYHVRYVERSAFDNCITPVIIIFGWGGCSDKYLSKYSEIYENAGCITFRCIVAPKILFPGKSNEVKLQSIGEKIVQILKSFKFARHPLYFHSFSNSGATVYLCISKLLRGNLEYKVQIKGCIFDSTPAKIYASNIIAAVRQAVKGSVITKYSYAFIVLTYMYAAAGCNWMTSLAHCDHPSSQRFNMYESLANEPNICPQLFLFSIADDVCPKESIEEFIEMRKSKGVNVTTVLWNDSAHVKHLVMYKEEYIKAVLDFICSDLRNEDNEP